MKIAILSDIHDNVWNLYQALSLMQSAGVIVCCGDLCSPFVVNIMSTNFSDKPIHIVFGNNDGDLFRIGRAASTNENVHLHGELFQGDLGGKRFVANHYDNIADSLAHSGAYDVVCYGHNHRYKVEQVGETLAINPGTIMGYDPIESQDIPATFVIYNTLSGETERIELEKS